MTAQSHPKLRWRYYRTAQGNSPVERELDDLSDEDHAVVTAAMRLVRTYGLRAAKPLRGDLYEVVAHGPDQGFRVFFAPEGRHGQVLLALELFSKKSQETPRRKLQLAEDRLKDWRERGQQLRAERGKQPRHRADGA